MATTEQSQTSHGRSTEELRAQMYRILDELCTARSDEAAALKTKFEKLWNEVGAEGAPTIH
jgi:hypothetical protein